jgi:SAM-dependent methyltransferase
MSGGMAAVPAAPAAIEQALALLDSPPESPSLRDGYLDLLGAEEDPTGQNAVQRLMVTRVVPRIYERFWRPSAMRVLGGRGAPGRLQERRIAVEMLALSGGERVLDVGCGPGNFTRGFAEAAGDGMVVGLDASETMLAAATRATPQTNVAYVRGDACALPFAAASFEAVCCFGALHLFEPPMRALEDMLRVLAPSGRLALMTTCANSKALGGALARRYGGMVMFGRGEITGALERHALLDIEQRVTGYIQFVSARKPAG